MASIKVNFRPSALTGHEGSIYYRIIHERKAREIVSGHHVMPSEWDERRAMVITSDNSERKSIIISIREQIRFDLERLTRIIQRLDHIALPYSAEDIIDEYRHYIHEYSLFNFMTGIIVRLKENGKIRTAETYSATLNSFKRFRNDKDVLIDSLTSRTMETYEAWLRQRGVATNTISFYTRILRAVYNRAVETDLTDNRKPFRHVYTGIDKTVKRALTLPLIREIKLLDLSLHPYLDYARDMFMLSFMLRGMSFIDMAFLKKTDRSNGHITYRRRKTGQLLTIAWTKDMQNILDKYPENKSQYLLPIIRKKNLNERCAYLNASYNINRSLKRIGEKIGITIPLTLYVARHSWASAAKAKGVPLTVISEGMGHDSETTTRIYLASLDTSAVDKANSLILSSI